MVFKKRSSKRHSKKVRFPRRSFKKSYRRRGSYGKFSRQNKLKIITVKPSISTFSKIVNPITKFQRKFINMYKVGAKNVYDYMTPYKLYTPGANLQVSQFFTIFNQTQMDDALATVALGYGGNGTLDNTTKSFWSRCTSEYIMTNSSNGVAFLDIYSYTTKDDTTNDPLTLWNTAMQDESSQTAINYTTYYGVTPLDASPEISAFFKLKAITHVILQPGQVHKFLHDIHKNQTISNVRIKDSTYMRGWTEFDLFTLRGAPMTASTASLVGNQLVCLDIIQTNRYEYKYIIDQNTNYAYLANTALGTIGQVYNQGSGAAVASAII